MIRGKLVTLRPFLREDLPHLRRWHDDGAVMRYWSERQPLVVEGKFEADLAPGGRLTTFERDGTFCICDVADRPIGLVQYEGSAPRDRYAELGILIGEQDAWNKGYGTEAIVLLLNWLFNQRGLHRVWLTVQAANPRAQRVYEKIGFVHEGTYRQQEFYDGGWNDEHVYGILVDEFNARYHPDRSDWELSGELP
jgi:RimJ/RimL family protein N-acetyltransferase